MNNIINQSGKVTWQTPSNLAIIKYWGKYGIQLPKNPSISLTLSEAHTDTTIQYSPIKEGESWIVFFLDQEENKGFADRIVRFFTSIKEHFPFIDKFSYIIHSSNSFPHSSGIASSASAMSALAVCLCEIESQCFGTLTKEEEFFKKASFIARLGSGSAARSVYGGWVEWGESAYNKEFSNLHGTVVSEIHESFQNMRDSILIASRKEKSVSSSAGHQLMENNVYAEARYQQAKDRIPVLAKALQEGDWSTFGHIAENEALTLHALMMSSEESYILMDPKSLIMIERIRSYRKRTGHHVYFSLDAGPNIHLLYPNNITTEIKQFIDTELKELCEDGFMIHDFVGQGPKKI